MEYKYIIILYYIVRYNINNVYLIGVMIIEQQIIRQGKQRINNSNELF